MYDFQKAYFRAIMPKVRVSISELKGDMGAWGKERRGAYLSDRLAAVQHEIQRIHVRYEQLTATDSPYINKYIITLSLDSFEKQLKKIQLEIKYLKKPMNGELNGNDITPDMIEQARSHPFEDFVTLQRGKALCPFHDDHNPSMGIKNNRYKCFSCGESGDVIDFVVKLEGLNFVQAVKRLQT